MFSFQAVMNGQVAVETFFVLRYNSHIVSLRMCVYVQTMCFSIDIDIYIHTLIHFLNPVTELYKLSISRLLDRQFYPLPALK